MRIHKDTIWDKAPVGATSEPCEQETLPCARHKKGGRPVMGRPPADKRLGCARTLAYSEAFLYVCATPL